MNDTELVKRLSTLLELDRDAVKLYDEAGRVMGDPSLGVGALQARDEHANHALRIEAAIKSLGQQPRNPTPDFESIMQLHMDSISSARDLDETMITLRMAERIMNLEYAEILEMDMAEDVRRILVHNREDERRHLQAVEQWLEDNVGAGVGVYL